MIWLYGYLAVAACVAVGLMAAFGAMVGKGMLSEEDYPVLLAMAFLVFALIWPLVLPAFLGFFWATDWGRKLPGDKKPGLRG